MANPNYGFRAYGGKRRSSTRRRTSSKRRVQAYRRRRRHTQVRAKGFSVPVLVSNKAIQPTVGDYVHRPIEITAAANAATNLTDRKIRGFRGVMDITAEVPADSSIEMLFYLLLANEGAITDDRPDVLSEYNPLDPSDIPGQTGYKGKHPLFRAWAFKRAVYLVPTDASTQTFTERIMFRSKRVRLVRPADRVFFVVAVKGDTEVNAGYYFNGRISMLDQ